MEIDFLTDSKDYSVAEFYEHFHTHLPVVVQVNQGFHGHIIEDTFGKGEILYIAAISKQRRVVAKVHTGKHCRVLSFPEEYAENLCIIKHGRPGRESSLFEIVKHHRLPVKVQYPPNDIIIMGNRSFSSNEIPHLELVKTFEEIYLLGNYLTNGDLGKDILHVPLYLSQLRLCRVTGMRYLSEEGWRKHRVTLKEKSLHVEYDLLFGNRYVAEYDHTNIRSDTNYAYAEPLIYDNFLNLIMHWPECHFGCSPNNLPAPESKDKPEAKSMAEKTDDLESERKSNVDVQSSNKDKLEGD